MTAFAVETAGCNNKCNDNNIEESSLDADLRERRLPKPRTTTKNRSRPGQPNDNAKEPDEPLPSVPEQGPQINRRQCCPYDFDSRICKVIDDRLLCGFNKNLGSPKSNFKAETLYGGCRLRGGRLECGYEHGPFTNPRRPPVWEQTP